MFIRNLCVQFIYLNGVSWYVSTLAGGGNHVYKNIKWRL